MKHSLAKFAVIVFAFSYFIPFSKADVHVDPKIKRAESCGFVFDPSGAAIPDVDLNFRSSDNAVSTKTDERGYFSAHLSGDGYLLKVNAAGFVTAEQKIERVSAPSKECRKPLYVLLEVGQGYSVIRSKKSDLPIAKKD